MFVRVLAVLGGLVLFGPVIALTAFSPFVLLNPAVRATLVAAPSPAPHGAGRIDPRATGRPGP